MSNKKILISTLFLFALPISAHARICPVGLTEKEGTSKTLYRTSASWEGDVLRSCESTRGKAWTPDSFWRHKAANGIDNLPMACGNIKVVSHGGPSFGGKSRPVMRVLAKDSTEVLFVTKARALNDARDYKRPIENKRLLKLESSKHTKRWTDDGLHYLAIKYDYELGNHTGLTDKILWARFTKQSSAQCIRLEF